MSLNKCFLQGRLTAVPEMRMTQSNKQVCTFNIAVDRDYKSETTDFINCVAWEKKAEFVNNYFTKGQQIIVEGKIQTRSYEDKNGQPHKVTEIFVESVYFCGSKNAAHDKAGKERTPVLAQPTFEELDDGGELPF